MSAPVPTTFVPHFHNEPGAAIVIVGSRKFMCMGAKPPFDHPHVFLDMGIETEIACPYCSTRYQYHPSLPEDGALPFECTWRGEPEMEPAMPIQEAAIELPRGAQARGAVAAPPKEEPGDSGGEANPKKKSAEEYYLSMHDKLLEGRKEATDFINIYLISCYGFLGLLILIFTNSLSKLVAGGLEIKLDQTYTSEYVATILLLAYVLVDFHLMRLGRILRAITRNSIELSRINPLSRVVDIKELSRVVDIKDMHLVVSGITGIMLSPARSQTAWMINKIGRIPIGILRDALVLIIEARLHPSNRSTLIMSKAIFRATLRIMTSTYQTFFASLLIYRLIAVYFIIFLPIVGGIGILLYAKYRQTIAENWISYFLQFDMFDRILVCASAVIFLYTAYAWLALCASYCIDVIISLINDLEKSVDEVRTSLGLPKDIGAAEIEALRRAIQNW